jgi:hypothetical protein
LGRDRTDWSAKHPIYSLAIDEAMGDGAMDVVDVADDVEDKAELVVADGLEVDEEADREEEDDCTDEVDREAEEEVMEVEVLIDFEDDDDAAAVEVLEVVEVLVDIDDARLDVLEEEIDDFEEGMADADEVADTDVRVDDDPEAESTDQTLILHVPPQI